MVSQILFVHLRCHLLSSLVCFYCNTQIVEFFDMADLCATLCCAGVMMLCELKCCRNISMYCKHCGKKIADDSKYCNFCGEQLDGNRKKIVTFFNENKLCVYIYVLYFSVHFYLYLFGGGGFSYSPSIFDTETVYEQDFLYPNGPKGYSFSIELYDITDFIFYVVILPVVVTVVYRMYQIKRKKRSRD